MMIMVRFRTTNKLLQILRNFYFILIAIKCIRNNFDKIVLLYELELLKISYPQITQLISFHCFRGFL